MEKLYINLPNDVKLKIDELFNFKQKQLDKIYFLIWKINTEVKHQLNIRNYAHLLGWKTGEMIKVINVLVDNNIIIKSDNYVEGIKSNAYSVINRFNITSTDYQLKYNSDFNSLPIWVQRYCADAGTAKAAKYSNYKKAVKSNSNAEVEALKLEVERLKELLKLNNIQFKDISPLEPLKEKDEVVVEEDEKLAVKSDNSIEKYDNEYELQVGSKTYHFADFSKIKKIAKDDDELYQYAQLFALQNKPKGRVRINDYVFSFERAAAENDVMYLIN